jgi:hypothetical protein
VFGRQVSVPHRHRQRGVPEQALKRRQRSAPHDEPAREVVPAAVQREGLLEPVQPRSLDRILERRAHVASRPYATLMPAWKGRQDLVDGLPHRDLAALAGLRLLQTQDTAAEVDPVPAQSQQLGPP